MCEFYKVSNFPWISYRKVPKDLEIIMTSPIIKNFFKRFFLRVMHFTGRAILGLRDSFEQLSSWIIDMAENTSNITNLAMCQSTNISSPAIFLPVKYLSSETTKPVKCLNLSNIYNTSSVIVTRALLYRCSTVIFVTVNELNDYA